MTIKNGSMPVMPVFNQHGIVAAFKPKGELVGKRMLGLTKREQFCLTKGVADTGDEELDAIITKGNKQKFAAMAMQGFKCGDYYTFNDMASDAVAMADALLAKLEEK